MDITSYLLGKNSSGGGGGGGSDLDWSAIGFEQRPIAIDEGYNYAKEIQRTWEASADLNEKFKSNTKLVYLPLVDTSITTSMNYTFQACSSLQGLAKINTSNVTTMTSAFTSCYSLVSVPLLDTSNVVYMTGTFSYCSNLKYVPQFNTSKISNWQNIFSACYSLTNESLNNILAMCININSHYSKTKTLAYLGISNSTYYPVSRIQALSNYQAFIDAGWTIGY